MRSYGQLCAVARALDVVGDRWTLLIVRELLIRPRARFGLLQAGLPGIASNLLTDRLRDLEQHGVLVREPLPGPGAGVGYRLTDRGRELEGTVRELLKWGASTVPDAPADAAFQMHWLSMPAGYLLRDGRPEDAAVVVRFGDLADGFDVRAVDGAVEIGWSDPDVVPEATVDGPGPALVGLIVGAIPVDQAPDASIRIAGDLDALRRILPGG